MRYGHGGDVFKAARALGRPAREISDMSASINPLGPSGKALRAAAAAMRLVTNYPEPYCREMAKKIAALHGLPASGVIPANGSTELIYLIPRALKPRVVLLHEPTFSEYERAALLAGARVKGLRGVSFKFDEFIGAMRGSDMAFLCNPNNPTGELVERQMVLALARRAEKTGCVLVVDEAFIDFCPESSVLDKTAKHRNLIVLRSMTKFHALTGLRAGYCACKPSVAEKLLKFKEPWTVNIPAGDAALAALSDANHAAKTYAFMRREKQFIERGLKKLGIWFFPSAANFYLIRVKGAKRFMNNLFEKGVLLRDCSNFGGLERGGYIRFAVKMRKENLALLRELSAWLSGRK